MLWSFRKIAVIDHLYRDCDICHVLHLFELLQKGIGWKCRMQMSICGENKLFVYLFVSAQKTVLKSKLRRLRWVERQLICFTSRNDCHDMQSRAERGRRERARAQCAKLRSMMSFPSALLSICRVQVNLIKTVLPAPLSLSLLLMLLRSLSASARDSIKLRRYI
jgi:hypothetical protein